MKQNKVSLKESQEIKDKKVIEALKILVSNQNLIIERLLGNDSNVILKAWKVLNGSQRYINVQINNTGCAWYSRNGDISLRFYPNGFVPFDLDFHLMNPGIRQNFEVSLITDPEELNALRADFIRFREKSTVR